MNFFVSDTFTYSVDGTQSVGQSFYITSTHIIDGIDVNDDFDNYAIDYVHFNNYVDGD